MFFLFSSVFNILVHVGVVLTYPILISIGTLLSVPGNAGRCFLFLFFSTLTFPQYSDSTPLVML